MLASAAALFIAGVLATFSGCLRPARPHPVAMTLFVMLIGRHGGTGHLHERSEPAPISPEDHESHHPEKGN